MVTALVHTGAECNIIHVTLRSFLAHLCHQWLRRANTYGWEDPFDTANWVFPPMDYDVFISLIPEDIIKINIPQGQTLQTSFIELCLWVKVIIPVVRGNANWDW